MQRIGLDGMQHGPARDASTGSGRAPARRSGPPVLDAAGVIALQRTIGNARVTAALSGGRRRALQRVYLGQATERAVLRRDYANLKGEIAAAFDDKTTSALDATVDALVSDTTHPSSWTAERRDAIRRLIDDLPNRRKPGIAAFKVARITTLVSLISKELAAAPSTQAPAAAPQLSAPAKAPTATLAAPAAVPVGQLPAVQSADVSAADPVVAQFRRTSAVGDGGLLMRGVESIDALKLYLGGVPAARTSQEDLKKRQYNTEKYSYIRADTTMRVFSGRNFGILLDWRPLTGHILAEPRQPGKPQELAIHFEDVQSGKQSKPLTALDFKAQGQVAGDFDQLVKQQNAAKTSNPAKLGNWNEIEMLSATADAYLGLFYATPTTKAAYHEVFTATAKQELANLWRAKTGQPSLKIYLYTHRGQPARGSEEAKATAKALGTSSASDLQLVETVAAR